MRASPVTQASTPRSAASSGRAAVARVPAGANGAKAPKLRAAASVAAADVKLQARLAGAQAGTKPAKAKKVNVVRASIAVPKPEFALLAEMKRRAGRLAAPVKKNKLVRAGIQALAALSDAAFLAVLQSLPDCKAVRPGKAR